MIIGEELCLQAEISFGPSGLRVRNLNNLCEENIPSILLKIDTVINNDELDINEAAGECAKQEVSELIMNYKPLKSKSTNIEMKILLNNESPIFSRPRIFAFAETNVIDEQIEEWLDKGIIEESDSEFTSPVVLAKKNDGSERLCVDFRRINKVIVKDHFPLPLIDDQLDRLQKEFVFSTIDLRNGFFHVPVAESSRKYTTFVTKSVQF